MRQLAASRVRAVRVVTASPAAQQDNYAPADWSAPAALHRVLRLTPTTSFILTGIADGFAGATVDVFNGSADYMVLVEDDSADSTAANRIVLRNPVFLLPGAMLSLWYDASSSRWRARTASSGIGFGAFFDVFEDFVGGTGGYGNAVTGTGASVQQSSYLINTTERPHGAWQADTGTTATGRAHIGASQANVVFPTQGQAINLTRLAVEALSNGTERFQVFSGFHDAVGATNVTDGAYWVYRDDVSAAWQSGVAAAGTRVENFAAGPTVDTNYIWLGVFVNAAWTNATFFYSVDSINWVIAGARASGLPTAAQVTGMGATINKTLGTTQRNLSIDVMAHRYDLTRG